MEFFWEETFRIVLIGPFPSQYAEAIDEPGQKKATHAQHARIAEVAHIGLRRDEGADQFEGGDSNRIQGEAQIREPTNAKSVRPAEGLRPNPVHRHRAHLGI